MTASAERIPRVAAGCAGSLTGSRRSAACFVLRARLGRARVSRPTSQ